MKGDSAWLKSHNANYKGETWGSKAQRNGSWLGF